MVKTDAFFVFTRNFIGYENEGWFDPWQLMNAFQRKASSLGAQRVVGEVIGFEFEENYSIRLAPECKAGGKVQKPKNALVGKNEF